MRACSAREKRGFWAKHLARIWPGGVRRGAGGCAGRARILVLKCVLVAILVGEQGGEVWIEI
jgi:hypothetical protein